ncbi:MAG: holo-ACP synthase [Candidatus Babeliales bacterium]
MILGIGIDIVETERFKDWHTKPIRQLLRIFSQDEIAYCQELQTKSSERFAVRYAAKEAFYKAYAAWQQKTPALPLITLCSAIHTRKNKYGLPYLVVNWHVLQAPYEPTCHISLSHTDRMAIAQVILEAPQTYKEIP